MACASARSLNGESGGRASSSPRPLGEGEGEGRTRLGRMGNGGPPGRIRVDSVHDIAAKKRYYRRGDACDARATETPGR
jgi:hypothetical protein